MADQLRLAVEPLSPVDVLQRRLKVRWRQINAARKRSVKLLERLETQLAPVVIEGTTCVVFGSLARLEFTRRSDIDWTLLIDSSADPYHADEANRIGARLRELKLTDPTPGGPFGRLTFSHDLIHRIGGDDDTNRNTTQRLLLLLESTPIGHSAAYDQVVGQVLTRYVDEDLRPRESPYRVPRFLQNDIVRYWRTMAVDFAHKRRARADGWALRTAKLRMSRKLIYVSGLLSCFSCEIVPPALRVSRPIVNADHVVDLLSGLVRATPLDIVAGVVLSYFDELSGPAVSLFASYDEFLGLLNDEKKRKQLKKLPLYKADDDPVYRTVRELSTRFEEALRDMFFTRDTPVRELTRRYGLF